MTQREIPIGGFVAALCGLAVTITVLMLALIAVGAF